MSVHRINSFTCNTR